MPSRTGHPPRRVSRRRKRAAAGLLALGLMTLGAAQTSAAAVLPSGFGETVLSSGETAPAAVDWAADGRMFVAHRSGLVIVHETDGTSSTILDIEDEVNNYADHGLLGLSVDRDFATNGYLYLLYVRELDPLNPDSSGPMASRLTRLTVKPDSTLVNPADPETVILGKETDTPCTTPDNTRDCIPADFYFHTANMVQSDPDDGTLWVSTGESHPPRVDGLSYRPYDVHSFAGKLIHVDRQGLGLPGHPFCPADTDLTHVCTKIYATGFRNPFRFTIRPGRGPALGDVGQADYEELDLVEAGRSYGWPCYEGPVHTPLYKSEARCLQEYAKEGTAAEHAPPAWSYTHPPAGAAIVAGPVYSGSNYPPEYAGRLFVGDYAAGWIKALTINASDKVTGVTTLGTGIGTVVDLALMPNGDLAYVDIGYGLRPPAVRRITYANGNMPPVPVAAADPETGAAPLQVQFTGSGSTDAEDDPLTYEWDFGDGTTRSSAADPTHTYAVPGTYTAKLTVDDGFDRNPNVTVVIEVGVNQPPTAEITAPSSDSTYRAGSAVELEGTGEDAEDGTLSGMSLSWQILLHHGTHVHGLSGASGTSAEFTPLTDHDADSHYEIVLTARDSAGRTSVDRIDLDPETSALTLASSPPGAPVLYAGLGPFMAPLSRTAAAGYLATIEAPEAFDYHGRPYRFAGWSDLGARKHEVTVPGTDSTLTARYQPEAPPDTILTGGPFGLTSAATPDFGFASDDPEARFECGIDGGSFGACPSPFRTGVLGDGPHSFSVRAVDAFAGTPDPSPATRSFVVDTKPPGAPRLTSSNPPSPSHNNFPFFLGRAEPDSVVRLFAAADCSGRLLSSGPSSLLSSMGLRAELPSNSRTRIWAMATDPAGNRGRCSPEPHVYVEDSRAPHAVIRSGLAARLGDRTPTLRFGADEAGSALSCRSDRRRWRRCRSPLTLLPLAPGNHVFYLRATDRAGNTGPRVSRRFTVEGRAGARSVVRVIGGLLPFP